MAAPPARFPIIVDDQTDAGFRSALNKANAFQRGIKTTFAVLGVAGGVGLLTGVIKESIQFGDELNKARIKAGIAGRDISELAYAAKQADVSLADLSTSLKFMQVNLSEAARGSKAQVSAFNELGLSVENLKKLSPDRQFELVADRISLIKDPADRARLAVDLFGKSGANLLPLFERGAAGIRQAREEAKKMGASLSEEQISKLAAADDSIKKLSASWKAFSTTLTAAVAPALSKVLDSLTEVGNGTAMERVGRAYSQNAIAQYGTDQQRAALRSADFEKELGGRFSGPGRRSRVTLATASSGGGGIPAYLEMVKTTALRFDEFQRKLSDDRALQDYIANLQDAYATNQALIEASDKGIGNLFEDTVSGIEDQLDGLSSSTRDTTEEFAVLWQRAGERSFDAVSDFLIDPLNGSFKDLGQNLISTFQKVLADRATLQIFKSLASFGDKNSGSGGFVGFLGGLASSLFGGYKASGGPLSPSKWYIAGEHGPEPIWGGGAGAFAMGYGGGGGSVSVSAPITIDARGASPDAVAQMQKALPEAFRRHGDAIEARIIDGLRRKRYAGV